VAQPATESEATTTNAIIAVISFNCIRLARGEGLLNNSYPFSHNVSRQLLNGSLCARRLPICFNLLCTVCNSKTARCTGCITTCRIALKIAHKAAKAFDEEHSDCVEEWAFTFVPVVLVSSTQILAQSKALGHAVLRDSKASARSRIARRKTTASTSDSMLVLE